MSAGQPYRYKRSSRSWVNALFLFCGAILLTLGLVDLRFGRLGFGRDSLLFIFSLGGIFSFGAAAGLLTKREWEMHIDERRLAWKDGKRSGEIRIENIKKVRVEEGDGRCLIVETIDSAQYIIPGECYGNASDLRAWLRDNCGKTLEVLN